MMYKFAWQTISNTLPPFPNNISLSLSFPNHFFIPHAVVITSGHLSYCSDYLWSPFTQEITSGHPSHSTEYLRSPSQRGDYFWSSYTLGITSRHL